MCVVMDMTRIFNKQAKYRLNKTVFYMHTTQVATAQLPMTRISGKNMGGNRDARVQVPMCAFQPAFGAQKRKSASQQAQKC